MARQLGLLPSIYEVAADAVDIMQMQVTRSRPAGDPPELLLTLRLADHELLDLDRADAAIVEGRRAVPHALRLVQAGTP